MRADDDRNRVGQRVAEEHASLSRRCTMLRARARRGETRGMKRLFGELSSDLLAHMGLEEHDLFPSLAFEAVGGPRLVARLHAEHAEIRGHLTALQADPLDIDRLDTLAELLERHRAHEERHLYPWAIAREVDPNVV